VGRRSWSVRDIAEILEHWQAGRNNSEIARSLGVDRKTVRKYVEAAKAEGINRSDLLTREQWAAFVKEHFPEAVDRQPGRRGRPGSPSTMTSSGSSSRPTVSPLSGSGWSSGRGWR